MDLTTLIDPYFIISYFALLIIYITKHLSLLFITGKTGIVYWLVWLYWRVWQLLALLPLWFLTLGCLIAVGGEESSFTFIKAIILMAILLSPLNIIDRILNKYFPL